MPRRRREPTREEVVRLVHEATGADPEVIEQVLDYADQVGRIVVHEPEAVEQGQAGG